MLVLYFLSFELRCLSPWNELSLLVPSSRWDESYSKVVDEVDMFP
jgi:hypothetical protein